MHLLLALLVLRIRSELKKSSDPYEFQISVQSHMNNNTRHIILSYFYLTKQSQIQKQRVENQNAPNDSKAWRSTLKQQHLEVMVSSLTGLLATFLYKVASSH